MAAATRPARADNGRRDLLDIAIDCFARYGYQGASIDRIAKAAGLTKGAIYYHFKDKEALLFAAVKNRVGQFERRVTRDLGAIEDAAAALRHVTEVCLEHATRSNHRRLIVTLMVEALDTNLRLSALFRDMMRRFRAYLAAIIEIGQRAGAFRRDVRPAVAAGVYAGAVMGAEIEYYQDPERVDLGAHLHAFLDSYLAWLGAAPPPARRKDAW